MAELLIKVGDGDQTSDGDCLLAFSDLNISATHVQHACKVNPDDFNDSGLVGKQSLAWHLKANTRQFRFDRISPSEVTKTNLWTNEIVQIDPKENVRKLVRSKRKDEKCLVFGEDGQETWFEGRTEYSQQSINRLWDKIEERTGRIRTEERMTLWPFGRMEIRSYLALRVERLTEKDVASLTEQQFEVDDNGDFVWEIRSKHDTVLATASSPSQTDPPDDRDGWRLVVEKERRRRINWEQLLDDLKETPQRIRDRTIPIGREFFADGKMRYTSKDQPHQPKTRMEKKQPAKRGQKA